MDCKVCGAEMRIVNSKTTEQGGKRYRVLTHKCVNKRCPSPATKESWHEQNASAKEK